MLQVYESKWSREASIVLNLQQMEIRLDENECELLTENGYSIKFDDMNHLQAWFQRSSSSAEGESSRKRQRVD